MSVTHHSPLGTDERLAYAEGLTSAQNLLQHWRQHGTIDPDGLLWAVMDLMPAPAWAEIDPAKERLMGFTKQLAMAMRLAN